MILDDHIVASSQQHDARKALKLSATPLEVVQSKKRKTRVVLESLNLVPVGQDWAHALIQEMHDNNAILQQREIQITVVLQHEMNAK